LRAIVIEGYSPAKSNAATFNIQHGRAAATGTHDPPIIIKAIALPATIVTGE